MVLSLGFLPQVRIPPIQHFSRSIESRWYCVSKARSGMRFPLPALKQKGCWNCEGKSSHLFLALEMLCWPYCVP